MLFVFNKEKIISYVIAFSTVAFLLCLSMVNTNDDKTAQVSSNKIMNDTVKNTIYGE